MGFFNGMFGDTTTEAESVANKNLTNGPDEEDFDGNEEPTLESIHIMNEVALLESFVDVGITELLENASGETTHMLQTGFVNESTVVRLDKKARISQLQKAAVFTIARERNDPKFRKLVTVWKMERRLENELMKKYGTEGMRRAKRHAQQNYRQRGKFFQRIADTTDKKIPAPGKATSGKKKASNVIKPK